jgi:hypothetical protein
MAMLMPDLVLAVAMGFERYGLGSEARPERAFDPNTFWRIPAGINVLPISPPIRKLRPQDVIVLNSRRAGNRGRAKRKAEQSMAAASPFLTSKSTGAEEN